MIKKSLITLSLALVCAFGYSQDATTQAFQKSYTLELKGSLADAIKTMQTVYDKDEYSINLRLGWLNYSIGDYVKSKKYYKIAISIKPKSIEARNGLIYPLSAIKNWEDVFQTYLGIVKIDPKNSKANYQLGYAYFLRKDYTKAKGHLQTVLDLYPFDYDSNLLMGSNYVKLGKIKEAKYHYNLALLYSPSSSYVKGLLDGL